jgi:hypothetical protein
MGAFLLQMEEKQMNNTYETASASTHVSSEIREKIIDALDTVLHGVDQCLDVLDVSDDDEDGEPILAALTQGQPVEVILESESYELLPCFGEDDFIIEAPDVPVLMSCDSRHILTLNGKHYLIGTAIFYEANEDGDIVSLTAQQIYQLKNMAAERTSYLCAGGDRFPALLLD